MKANVEIKARVSDSDSFADLVGSLSGGPPEVILQHDVFFHVVHGRLKLRMFADETGELIQYVRPDRGGPGISRYVLAPTDHPALLREALAAALGEAGEVRKRRRLWLVGRTRIHLDEVDGLGSFMELEVVLADGESTAEGEEEAEQLRVRLGVQNRDLIDRAYVDLLAEVGS